MENENNKTSIWTYLKWGFYGIIGIAVLFNMFGGEEDYIEEVLEDPTQGVIVELQESSEDLFAITNEELIDKREDSRIIVTYLDQTIDTFGIDSVSITSANDPRRSVVRAMALGGLLGYVAGGRPMSQGVNRSAYASQSAFDKSNTNSRTQMRSTSTKRTVKRSYGSGKSTRSYGG